jgi:hypothetical protein
LDLKNNEGVVREQHYTLNWIANYFDQNWDEVTVDI